MAIRVGRWDCQQCGHTGVLGPLINCPACGSPRGKDVKFYLPDNAEIVDDLTKIQEAKAGSDWVCSHCDSGNKNGNEVCFACGNPRDASDEKLQTREYETKDVPKTDAEARKKNVESAKTTTFQNTNQYTPTNGLSPFRKRVLAGFGAAFFVFIVVLGFLINWHLKFANAGAEVDWQATLTRVETWNKQAGAWHLSLRDQTEETSVTIQGFSWERAIDLEKLITVQHEGTSVPSDGRVISSRQEIDYYKDVPDGYETKTRTVSVKVGTETYNCGQRDLGNGYFEDKTCTRDIYEDREESYQEQKYRKEPVYKTVYTYLQDEWHFSHQVKNEAANHQPYWPKTNVSSTLRESKRLETYVIAVVDSFGHHLNNPAALNVWEQLKPGQHIPALKYRMSDRPFKIKETGL